MINENFELGGIDLANFDRAIEKTLIHEGGDKFTSDPNDRGGDTKFGISQRAYPELDIKSLTEKAAKEIYKRDYWDKVKADQINSQQVAENIFDTAVNMGVRTASLMAQEVLDIKPADGIIGPQSLEHINVASVDLFISKYTLLKVSHYVEICRKNKSQKKYLLGWMNRTLEGVV